MKTITKLVLVSIAFLSFHLALAEVRTEKVGADPFTHIDIDGAFTVIIEQGDKEQFSIEADNHIMPYIKSSVKNNTLNIKLKTGIGSKKFDEIKLYITIKDLESLKLSGFINLRVSKQITLEDLALHCTGAVRGELNSSTRSLSCKTTSFSELELSGTTETLTIDKTDASSVNAFQLKAHTVRIESSGFGEVNVSVENTLDITSKGAAVINYQGNPEIAQMNIKGFSTLNKVK